MEKPFSATPFLRQLYKALSKNGHEILIIPYSGQPIQSSWWKCYPNPNYSKSAILENLIKKSSILSKAKNSSVIPFLARTFAKPKLEKLISKVILEEKDISCILFVTIPLNQISGLATSLKKKFCIPILFYDVDLPTSLPEHGGFTFNYYTGADLTEYDSVLVTSEGSIPRIKEMGATSVETVHIGVDPDEYRPLNVEKDIDFFFFGHGGKSREKFVKMMITEPSKKLNYKFVLGGRDYAMDLGNTKFLSESIDFSSWINYSCRSKINLNLVHELHANTFATSTARPFELGAMGCCIVSSPYKGLEKWFEIDKEIMVVNTLKECLEVYQYLIENPEERLKIGKAIQQRVIKEHTSSHRAKQIAEIIKRHS